MRQLFGKIIRVVIQTLIKSQHVDRMTTFFRAARDAYHMTAFNLADLPDGCPDWPGGRSDYQRLARLRLADIQQPHIRGETRHPQHTQRPGRIFNLFAQLDEARAVREFILLPAAITQYPLARFKFRMVRLLYATDRAAHHYRANVDRR
ncbi:hypothetical protein D3C76_803190 [compost metagenome]